MNKTNYFLRKQVEDGICYAVLVVIALLTLSPLWILCVNAFKPHAAIVDNPLSLPAAWDFQYIITAAQQLDYGKSILITFIVTVLSVALIVLVSSMAAWILARRKGKM